MQSKDELRASILATIQDGLVRAQDEYALTERIIGIFEVWAGEFAAQLAGTKAVEDVKEMAQRIVDKGGERWTPTRTYQETRKAMKIIVPDPIPDVED